MTPPRPRRTDDRSRGPVTPARADLAHAIRELSHRMVAADADDAALVAATTLVEQAQAALDEFPLRRRPLLSEADQARMSDAGSELTLHAMSDRAVGGVSNPMAVDFEMTWGDGAVITEVEFGPAFEGAPGRLHGGVLAGVFDDVLGAAMAQEREPGFTGRLTVHYLAPVPVERPITIRTWVGERQGRKLFVHGEATHDGTVVARADALFILVDAARFRTHVLDLVEGDGAS